MDRRPGQTPPIPRFKLANRQKCLAGSIPDMMGCEEINIKTGTLHKIVLTFIQDYSEPLTRVNRTLVWGCKIRTKSLIGGDDNVRIQKGLSEHFSSRAMIPDDYQLPFMNVSKSHQFISHLIQRRDGLICTHLNA